MGLFGIGNKTDAQERIKAYFFTRNRRFLYTEVLPSKEEKQLFEYPPNQDEGKKQFYNIDISAVQFFTDDKKPVFFYIEGIPNPVRFDLAKNIQKFVSAKRQNPEALVFDDAGRLIDISFSSNGIEYYKSDNFLKKLQKNITPEQLKIIIGLIIVVGIAFICNVLIVLLKK